MDRAAEHLLKLPYETILSVFAMPQSDGSLDAVTDEGIRQLGRACKRYNDLGLRILVNFGHEGNGYWWVVWLKSSFHLLTAMFSFA
jgi:hypothetical protein